MKTEIIQGPPLILSGREKPCAECEEEKNGSGSAASLTEDKVRLSQNRNPLEPETEPASAAERSPDAGASETAANRVHPRSETELTPEEKQVLDQLRSRDREVRSHEQAHKAAAGPYAQGPPTYEYQTGPDGRRYAVGGEVRIDTSEVPGNPRATLVKAQTIKRAANAPKNPSAQDRQVAAQAAQMEAEARRELAELRAEESGPNASGIDDGADGVHPTSPAFQPDGSGLPRNAESHADENTRTRKLIEQFEPDAKPERGDLLNTVS